MPLAVSKIRETFPALDQKGMSDDDIVRWYHKQFYPEIPIGTFTQGIDYDTGRARAQQQTLDDTNTFLAGMGHPVQQLVNSAKRAIPGSGYTREDAQEEARLAAPLMNTPGGMAGGVAGEMGLQYLGGRAVRGALGALGRESVFPQSIAKAKGLRGAARDVAGDVAQGAVWGTALSPEDWSHGATVGGTVGGVVGPAVRGAGALVTGPARNATSADAQALQRQGINVPLWKATENRTVRGLAERARALPIAGDVMKGQEREALVDYNRAFTQSAVPMVPVMDEVGNILRWERPEITGVGQEGMRQLHEAWQKHYAPLRTATIPLDEQLGREMHGIGEYAQNYRSGSASRINDALREVNDIFNRAVNERPGATSPILDATGRPIQHPDIPGHAGVTGDDWAQAIEAVQQHIDDAWGSGTSGESARLLTQLRESLLDARRRNAPPEIAEIGSPEAADAYKNYDLLRRASSSLGAVRRDGLVTPEQATAAVKAKDTSYAKGATTRGEAWGQQTHQQAHRVLGSEIPDVGPGTAEKSFFPHVLGAMSGGGWLGGLPAAAAIGGGAALASRPGQRFLQGGYPWQDAVRPYVDPMADYMRMLGVSMAGNAPSNR